MLIHDDCLHAMKNIENSSIDMIYLDPPFFTQKTQRLKNEEGIEYSFDDKWTSMGEYLQFLKERVTLARDLLNETGSLFLHCDNAASHYIKIMLDEIFGLENFRSEIVWTYRRWSNSKNGLLNAHQIIFFYSKSSHYKFHKIYTDYSVTTNIDQILQDRVRDKNGKVIYKTDDEGQSICSNKKQGVPLSDVWEIPFLNPKAKERVGYPTQKPILLLERIIEISTDEGDVVLDPFCGSGTTLIAAHLNNRKYIGIDKNPEAIRLATQRLAHPLRTNSTLLKMGKRHYDEKSELDKCILSHFDCNIVQRNKGIDAILVEPYQGRPVAIRIQKENELLSEAIHLLSVAGKKRNCSLMVLIETNASLEFFPPFTPQNIIIIESYHLTFSRHLSLLDGLSDVENG